MLNLVAGVLLFSLTVIFIFIKFRFEKRLPKKNYAINQSKMEKLTIFITIIAFLLKEYNT